MGRSVLSPQTSYESMWVQVPPGCHAEAWPGLLHEVGSSPHLYVPSQGFPTPSLGLQWFGVLSGVISHPQPINLFGPLLISLQDCVCCWSSSAHAGKCPKRGLPPWMESVEC